MKSLGALRARAWLPVCAAVLLLVLAARGLLGIDVRQVAADVVHANTPLLALALLVFYATFIVRAIRWRQLLENIGAAQPLKNLMRALLLGSFLNSVSVAQAGDVYRAYLLKRDSGTPFTITLGTVVAERLLDLVSLLVLLCPAIVLSYHMPAAVQLTSVAAAGVAACALFALRVAPRVRPFVQRRLPARWHSAYENLERGALSASRMPVRLAALSSAAWLIEGATLYLLASAVGANISPATALLAGLVASVLSAEPITPGGLGATEPGIVVVLTSAGVDATSASAVAVLNRLVNYASLAVAAAVLVALSRFQAFGPIVRGMSLNDSSVASAGVPAAAEQHDTSSEAQRRARGRRAGLARRAFARTAIAASVVALVGLGIVDRAGDLSVSSLTNAVPVLAAQNSAQDSAIQSVIQRSNAEQAQAIASKDPSVMADTATTSYYQQLQQINQDLLSNGVSSIALTNLEWGPVNVSDTTATATTYETWQTTYADGSTDRSRDENDYSLVLQNGSWVITSDDHPTANTGRPSTTTAPVPSSPSSPSSPSAPSTTRNPGNIATSNNWSGYAATGGTYTAVSGTWTVPDYSAGSSGGVDATWVGIGGVSSRDLIQAGTQQASSGSGQTQYQAWIEMLPAASHPVPLAVRPGDSVSVSIDEQNTGTWQISFTNNTTGQTYQTSVQYTSTNSSAEWIEEAPSAGRGGILPLDNFGSVNFTAGSAVKDGQSVSIASSGARAITLIGANQQPLAVPSAIGSDGSSFSVSRTQAAASATSQSQRPGRGYQPVPVLPLP
ncbi:MAG: flippase-like domain-containing protein [Chloroflexi bacterium]|nr:flippase-like domain-containing protein [Chloroflexota bacterium]